MKVLKCEMCGDTNLLKENGVYVCQSCGCKYSPEEAKKMIVEGTVRVDESSKIDNYYTMAENAYDAGNQREAENYCNKIIEIDPLNYAAWFLKGKAAGWQSTLGNIRIEEAVSCFTKAIDNAPEEEVEDVMEEASSQISSLSTALMRLCCNNFAEYPSKDNKDDILNNLRLVKMYSLLLFSKCGVTPKVFNNEVATMMDTAAYDAWKNVITKDYKKSEYPSKYKWEEFKNRCFCCIDIIQESINLSDDDNQNNIQRYKNLIYIRTELVNSCSFKYYVNNYGSGYRVEYQLTEEAKQLNIDDIMKYHEKIKEIDPSYEIPQRPSPKASGGCYVATCVYGSYDCPQVWTLRRYRDNMLARTWYGRAFIHTYYAISPTLVKWFGGTKWFKKLWKNKLDKMVSKLQSEGVENTPYQDKIW